MIVDSAVLRREMVKQKIGVNALGRKAGIQARSVSRLSRFDCKATAPTIGKLADALKLAPEDLIKAEKSRD